MSKTILCADDSVTMQKVAEITFAGSEYRYVGAKSADEAIKLARNETPGLVLADAGMPGKTGYDLCQAIKGDAALAGVPVVLLCGNGQPWDAARGAQVGADGFLPKPWDTQQMLDKVGEYLSGGAAKPAAAAAAKPAAAVAAAPAAKPAAPTAPAAVQPPRSATIMGMPAFPLPAAMLGNAGAVPSPAATPAPQPVAPPSLAVAPKPAAAASAARPAGAPDRAPMVKSGRFDSNQRIIDVLGRMPKLADVAQEAGLDPRGPEMQALLKLSFEVVEKVVWEVVPELAEQLIRDNLEKRAR